MYPVPPEKQESAKNGQEVSEPRIGGKKMLRRQAFEIEDLLASSKGEGIGMEGRGIGFFESGIQTANWSAVSNKGCYCGTALVVKKVERASDSDWHIRERVC